MRLAWRRSLCASRGGKLSDGYRCFLTLLPILERELRVRARSRATFWTRFAVVLIGVLFCLPQLLVSGPLAAGATAGKYVFDGMVAGIFLLCCCSCLLSA